MCAPAAYLWKCVSVYPCGASPDMENTHTNAFTRPGVRTSRSHGIRNRWSRLLPIRTVDSLRVCRLIPKAHTKNILSKENANGGGKCERQRWLVLRLLWKEGHSSICNLFTFHHAPTISTSTTSLSIHFLASIHGTRSCWC